MSLNVVLIGRSTIEAIPLFHLYPGGSALRLLLRPSRSLECTFDVEVCEWAKGPEVFPSIETPISLINHLIRLWGCDILSLDGIEPLESVDVRILREHLGSVVLVARAHGFKRVSEFVDYYLVEDLSIPAGNPGLRGNVLGVIDKLISLGKPFEVHVYIDNPYMEELEGIVEVLKGTSIPLHVAINNPRGGGPVKSLYQELRKILRYVYVHTRIYDEVDTLCPNCGTILLHRSGNILRAVNLANGKCPKCGTQLHLVGVVRGRTRESLARITRGGVVWYNPLFYKSILKL